MKILLTLGLGIFIFLMNACKCSKQESVTVQSAPDSKVMSDMEQSTMSIYNSSKTYRIDILENKLGKNNRIHTLHYKLFQIKDQRLIFEDMVPGGKVLWISDTTIEVRSKIGRPRKINTKEHPYLYRYNIISKTKSQF